MFNRPHHQRIYSVLTAIDSSFLSAAQCYFGGGTAIVLALGEYRESIDIDFLCESDEGYRNLRTAIFDCGLAGIFKTVPEQLRDTRMDQYGIRTVLQVDGVPVKFEIVKEGRIQIAGETSPQLGVPVLTRDDMFAEKLLANADRFLDAAVASRDIIDLAMMIEGWGDIPAAAWDKARGAYGHTIDKAYAGAVKKISDRDYLVACIRKMQMEEIYADRILKVFSAATRS